MISYETDQLIEVATRNLIIETVFIVLFAVLMLLASMVDLKTGISKAKAKNQVINSGGLKKTFIKFGDYAKVYYFGIVIDIAIIIVSMAFTQNGLVIPVGVMFCSLGACLTEFKSVRENLRESKSKAAQIPENAMDAAEELKKLTEAIKCIKDNLVGAPAPAPAPVSEPQTENVG